MQKFRSHKSKIIQSKRDSQKIEQLQLLTLKTQKHLQNNCFNLAGMANQKLHTITQQHYKINKQNQQEQNIAQLPQATANEIMQKVKTKLQQQWHCKTDNSQSGTFKTDSVNDSPAPEQHLLGNILTIMKTINNLQQKCSPNGKNNQPIKKQIKSKVAQFKQLLGQFQSSFQSSLLDFYNQQHLSQSSPKSFNSRSSEQSEPVNTDRAAYEMAERQDYKKSNQSEEPQIQLKYRRITESTQSLDTFGEDAEKDYSSPQKQLSGGEEKQSKTMNESSIIHLFSYQKQKCLQSPLPSITQRSSQYCSPDSKHPTNHLFSQSLEYKKIFYLLQTTEKKKETARVTLHHDVSQFSLSNRTNKSNSKSSNICESIDRSKSHSQLKDMINLLQTKYKRSFKKENQSPKGSLDAVLNSKSIKLRGQR